MQYLYMLILLRMLMARLRWPHKNTLTIMCFLAINLFFLVVSTARPGFAESEGRFELSLSNGFISLDAKNASLYSILSDVSEKTGLQIKSHGKLNQRITERFQELPIDEALRRISDNIGMVYSKLSGKNEYRLDRVVIVERSTDQGAGQNNISNPTAADIMPQAGTSELIVQFVTGGSEAEIYSLIDRLGAVIKEQIPELDSYVLSLPDNISIDQALSYFSDQNLVATGVRLLLRDQSGKMAANKECPELLPAIA